jgi:hypothetical protein
VGVSPPKAWRVRHALVVRAGSVAGHGSSAAGMDAAEEGTMVVEREVCREGASGFEKDLQV